MRWVLSTWLMVAALAATAQERPQVVAVNWPLASLAEQLGGGAIDVVFPVPEGVDPAFWRPGIADLAAIQAADLILLNGAGYADWVARVSLPRSRLVETTRGMAEQFIETESIVHSHGDAGAHTHAGTASHTWLDPALARHQADSVASALKRLLPDDASAIDDRRDALEADFAALDASIAEVGAAAAGRALIATHPRYQYLARAAGADIQSLDWDAGAAPDEAQLAALAALSAESGAVLLLWEAAPPDAARAAVAGLGLADFVLPPFARSLPEGFFPSALTTALDGLARRLADTP